MEGVLYAGATAAGRLFRSHLSTIFFNLAKIFGRGARLVWEQQLQVGLINLIHPSALPIPQSILAWGKRAVDAMDVEVTFRLDVGVGAAGVSLRPHPTNEFIDPPEQFGPAQS